MASQHLHRRLDGKGIRGFAHAASSLTPFAGSSPWPTLQRNPGIVITSLTMSRTCRLCRCANISYKQALAELGPKLEICPSSLVSRDSCSLWHSINWEALLPQLALERCARSCTELQITTGGISEDGAARWAAIEGHEAWQTSRPMVQGK